MGKTAKAQRLPRRKTLRAEFFVLPIKEIFTRPSRHRRFAVSPFRRFARLLDSGFRIVAPALHASHRLLCPL
jgi:hypothetical protein